MKGAICFAFTVAALLAIAGCAGAAGPSASQPAPQAANPASSLPQSLQQPGNFALEPFWYKGKAVTCYDFGSNTQLFNGKPMPATMWEFRYTADVDPAQGPVEGEYNIIDTVPGNKDYSDLWWMAYAPVNRAYTVNSNKSMEDMVRHHILMYLSQNTFVNRPVVPAGSTIEDGRALVKCWYRGQEAYYYDFGANDDAVSTMWAPITGSDEKGNPIFVKGQNNIVDTMPGDKGYSAFRQVSLVTVPSGYAANTLKSADDVARSGYPVTQTNTIFDCPAYSAK